MLLPALKQQLNIIDICRVAMANSGTIDYSDIVLILGNFVGADGILQWSDNSRFEFTPPVTGDSWKGNRPSEQELTPPFLCLKIRENLYDPKGWILGSHEDSDMCDLQIATTNQTGISRQACRIDISPDTHQPRVTQLSDRQLHLYGTSVVRSKLGVPCLISCPTIIELGTVQFRIWTPKRTAVETFQYRTKARQYSQDIMDSIPKRLPSIQTYEETSVDAVRYGANGTVYVVDEVARHGKGAHASVMKVKDIRTGECFGAKEPYFKISDNADLVRQRFEALRTEYNHIKRLDHPHILKAFDLVVAEDLTLPPWMIVEYIPYNLREALPTLNEHNRIAAIAHIGSALAYLHANGITHRDLKPENVLIVQQGAKVVVKLADFGTSKQNDSAKMATFTGTEIYMAPELFIKPRSYTSKVDMWALGLIGMQLFTSWGPSNDDWWHEKNFAAWVCTVALPRISEAPVFLQPMLKGLLRKDARKRWSSGKCLRWLSKNESLNSPALSQTSTDGATRYKTPSWNDSVRYSEQQDPDTQRRRRNPSLSTVRASTSACREEGGLPDTASQGSNEPDTPSTPSTPRPDEGVSFLEQSDGEESSGGDTDLEDWQTEFSRGKEPTR